MERRVVAGLTFAEWRPADEPALTVLALHGLTSTSQVWQALAEALPHARVIAPDLPGRAGSIDYPAGPGLSGHTEAVLRLADELGLRDVVVVGHSMGAFLAPLVAARLGARAHQVVLVDGGVPPERSVLIRRPVVRALFWVQMKIVGRPWRDAAAFVDKIEGRAIKGRPDLRPALLEWAEYALAGPPGARRPRMDARRCVADAVDTLAGDATLAALAGVDAPVHLIAAARGADDGKAAFLSDAAIDLGRKDLSRLTVERADANHLTVLFDPRIPAAVTARG